MIDLSRAKVNKRIPKNRFNKAELLDVDTITWLYKISPDTAEFRHGDEIDEIQIFNVSFKGGKVNKKDFFAIQKAIPYSILFLSHGRSYYIIEGELFESGKRFLDGDTLMLEQWSAKLTDLHENIAESFMPINRKATESIAEFLIRFKSLQMIERTIMQLQSKVDNEKQPNKRFEYNDKIKQLRKDLEGIK